MSKIKVLIVDDSAFMRKSISIMVESDKDIEVIATARDGEEGYNLAKSLKPDIITLDIEMPKMDGLTALKKIMKDCPTSVLMVSSLTSEGADATLKALEYGAVDFIPKELSYINVNIIKVKEDLIRKIKEIVRHKQLRDGLTRLRRIKSEDLIHTATAVTINKEIPKIGFRAIVLGVSTGGPLSLQKVIPKISKKINVPMFLVQHMPPKFTKSLADRLNGMSELEVKEAEAHEPVRNNVVYIAPGGFHLKLKKGNFGQVTVDVSEQPNTTLHRPSVDVMMESVISVYGKYTLGVIMTGMGKDGLEGIKLIKSLGGYSIAQNEESCIVYGMPKAVVDSGFADVISPLEKIADEINKVMIR